MSHTEPTYRSFPDYVESAYRAVHEWLSTVDRARGYRRLAHEEIIGMLDEPTLLSAAGQFYDLLPAHYFKVAHALENVVGLDRLLAWLSQNPHLCLVDVGCGAGTASAGFVETILDLQEEKDSSHPVDLFCLGVDVNPYALALYDRFMKEVKDRTDPSKVRLEHKVFPEGIPEAVLPIIRHLRETREQWQQPCLAHVFVMQVNVVSPLSRNHDARQLHYSSLRELGVGEDHIADYSEEFGETEALAYKQLFEEVPIDHMHVITIGTEYYLWEQRVKEMASSLERALRSGRHPIERHWQGNCIVHYENPIGSYWRTKAGRTHSSPFHIDFSTVSSISLQEDRAWKDVIAIDNLKLAWARVRKHFLSESLFDETEVRLFEIYLDENIVRLQRQLIAYAEDVICTDDRISYEFPKGSTDTRPRGLSRMEEEILSVAIIQKLGKKADGLMKSSYAYHIAEGSGTEYLYRPWFNAYHDDFLFDARTAVQKMRGCAVARTDVEAFYTRIIQDRLVDLASRALSESERVRWLLRLLLSTDLDEHEVGRGIVQGNLGSGFYANVYLSDIDARFGPGNEWDVKFFRYVDDMILVVPNPEDVKEVLNTLDDELEKLGLTRHPQDPQKPGKTEIYYDTSEFLEQTERDDVLEHLSEQYDQVANALWIMNTEYRSEFRPYYGNDNQWWYYIGGYRDCLQNIGIHVTSVDLSRKVFQYLFNPDRCQRDLQRPEELALPDLPPVRDIAMMLEWAESFKAANPQWVADRHGLHTKLIGLLCESWEELKSSSGNNPGHERRLRTRIRFAVNKLAVLGFSGISGELFEILKKSPAVVRNPMHTLESLVRQGFSEEIIKLLEHYQNTADPISDYMRAVILRALRYLPRFEPRYWDVLIDYTMNGSDVECLMATESWLYLSEIFTPVVQEHHISALKKNLDDPSFSSRLKKNYLLIIGQHAPNVVHDFSLDKDYIFDSVRKIISGGGVGDLLVYEEPEIIRQTYYGGKRRISGYDEY